MSDSRFDWMNDESVVLRPRAGLAIYVNRAGDVVVRQQGDWPDEDVWITFPTEDAEYVAMRITRAVEESYGFKGTDLLPAQEARRDTSGPGGGKSDAAL